MTEDNKVIPLPKRRRLPTKESVAKVAESASRTFLAIARASEIIASVTYVLARELGLSEKRK